MRRSVTLDSHTSNTDFIDKLPRLDSGKIYKRLLRERYRRQGAP